MAFTRKYRLPCASSSLLLTSSMSASAASNCHSKWGKFASPASHRSFHHLHIEAVWLLPGNMILCSPSFLTTTRVSGATIYAGLSYILLRTSKPVSRLIKASCNPLSADEILFITVFISTRCSSEMAARPTNSLRTSDRTPDGVGLFCPLSSGAGH